jgi:hypothetical protein
VQLEKYMKRQDLIFQVNYHQIITLMPIQQQIPGIQQINNQQDFLLFPVSRNRPFLSLKPGKK